MRDENPDGQDAEAGPKHCAPGSRVPGQDESEPRPPFVGPSERRAAPELPPLAPAQRVGFAVVGLGRLSLEAVLPAFAEAKLCRLAALVTGDHGKGLRVAAQHGLAEQAVYGYDELHRLRDNPDVHVVYVVTPNGLHRDHVIRAASAGKHVLCEKPMANSSAEAEQMIAACAQAGVKLMIAYRTQYEPHNRTAIRMARSGEFGALKLIEAHNGQVQDTAGQWRHDASLAGGGALPDIGLYCLSFARFITGEEPAELFAWSWSTPGDPRFREVEENVAWQMRFPSGIVARLSASYDAHEARPARLYFQRAVVELQPAFSYSGIRLHVSHRSPEREDTEVREERISGEKNQFALEMDHMARCVLTDQRPHTPGEEGLQDQRLMEAIYRSARDNRPIALPPAPGGPDAFRGPPPEAG